MVYFKKIAAPGKYHDGMAVYDVLAYITRRDKTPSGNIFSSHDRNFPIPMIASAMRAIAIQYGKYSHIRLYHFILAFNPNAVNLLPFIANDICDYIGRTYQVVVAQHEDRLPPEPLPLGGHHGESKIHGLCLASERNMRITFSHKPEFTRSNPGRTGCLYRADFVSARGFLE